MAEENCVYTPCNVGDIAYEIINGDDKFFVHKTKVDSIAICKDGIWIHTFSDDGLRTSYREEDIGKKIFFNGRDCFKYIGGMGK